MGYLVACFYFLLVGGDLLLKPVRSILLYWDCLIGYNVFVITMKNVLSVGCLTIILIMHSSSHLTYTVGKKTVFLSDCLSLSTRLSTHPPACSDPGLWFY